MTKTTNCNLYKEKYDIYCGRGKGYLNNPMNCSPGEYGWLGNPIAIGKQCYICGNLHTDNGSTLPCYKKYLQQRLEEPLFKKKFFEMKGKKLGCFCKPKPCHTDIMIEILDG